MTVASSDFVSPMLVSRGPLPRGPGYAYEVKWDGIRGQVEVHDDGVTIRSRPGRDCSKCFPELSEPPTALARRGAVLDGEIVCLDCDGYPDFAAIRARLTGARTAPRTWLAFMAFDVLLLDGEPATDLPYRQRRELLAALGIGGPTWRVPMSFEEPGPLLAATRDHGIE